MHIRERKNMRHTQQKSARSKSKSPTTTEKSKTGRTQISRIVFFVCSLMAISECKNQLYVMLSLPGF